MKTVYYSGLFILYIVHVNWRGRNCNTAFPGTGKFNKLIDHTYLSFRIVECLLLLVRVLVYLFCLLRESINSGTQVYAIFQSFRSIAIDMRYLAYQIAMIVLGTSSLFFCYLLMQSKLILTVLAVQGLVGYLFLLLSAILDIFVIVDTIRGIGLIM